MKNSHTGPPGQAGPRDKANGAARRAAAQPATATGAADRARGPEPLAPFSAIAPTSVGAPAWPVHLTLWLEPELETPLPRTSGLRVERTHRLPSGTFHRAVEPLDIKRSPLREILTAMPELHPVVPRSGLLPLGWEPRSILAAAAVGAERRTGLQADTQRHSKEVGR